MSRSIRSLLALLILAAVAVVPMPWAASQETPAPAQEKTATVNMLIGQMLPQHLEVTTGTTITWVNMEPADYPAVRGSYELVADHGAFASPPIAPGTRWAHRFNRPGTFRYHCKNHSQAAGEIVVTGPPMAETPAEQEVAITEDNPDDPSSWGFRPADLLVEAGTTVVWRNNGKSTHTVTANDGAFNSGDVAPGATWKQRFDSPGVFAYHCTPHPWMKAMVRVVLPGGPPPEPPPAMEHSAGAMSNMGSNEGGAQTTGTGPARLTVDIVEPDPSNPNSWRFNPTLLDLRTGDTVVWHNRGSVGHTVTSDSGLFDSGPIQPAQTWERTFNAAGLFGYHCTPHPWMRAKLRVAEPGKDAPAVPASAARAAAIPTVAASTPPFRRVGTAPARVPVNIVEPEMADAMKWGFAPQVIDVKVGDTVVWHNTASLQHSVTGDSGSFDSGLLSPGANFERRFDSPGVFAYHCTPHPWMKGAVRVTSDGAAPPPVPTLGSPMAPGEQAAGPMTGDAQAQPGALGIGPISLGGPINYGSNRLFFLSLLAAAAVLWLTWLAVKVGMVG